MSGLNLNMGEDWMDWDWRPSYDDDQRFPCVIELPQPEVVIVDPLTFDEGEG